MQDWTEQELKTAIQWKRTFCVYLYTPMCGTCQVASRMLSIVLEMFPDITCGKMNMNFAKDIPAQYEIESVPCLLIFKEGQPEKKIYAFQSVPYLYDILKGAI
ncbi:thioredoxin family protein [Peribacillus glennii]|uniref:Thioredoxin n=1 Tax=Peribacillus glennii TaxID=2303991 RepID=A0A372LCT7_9BACI|nr:thioredoxin family protein [Peribacillus glennii]RFU63809.1 thioredoxin [Peribacillus glennii]